MRDQMMIAQENITASRPANIAVYTSDVVVSAVAIPWGDATVSCQMLTPTSQAMPDAKHSSATDTIHYFAYGANMASKTLAKREIKPVSACPARLPAHFIIHFRHRGGYATIMDTSAASDAITPWRRLWNSLPVSNGSRSLPLAAGSPGDNSSVYHGPHGVLYELCQADMRKLASRETGYSISTAAVNTYTGLVTSALLFTSQPLLLLPASVPPQHRYLQLMLEGAQTHCLCPEYRRWLHQLASAKPGGLGAEYFDTPSEWLARCAAVGLAAFAAVYAAVH